MTIVPKASYRISAILKQNTSIIFQRNRKEILKLSWKHRDVLAYFSLYIIFTFIHTFTNERISLLWHDWMILSHKYVYFKKNQGQISCMYAMYSKHSCPITLSYLSLSPTDPLLCNKSGLQSEFQDSQGYTENPFLEKQNKTEKKKIHGKCESKYRFSQ
jgi:hypothetical protein